MACNFAISSINAVFLAEAFRLIENDVLGVFVIRCNLIDKQAKQTIKIQIVLFMKLRIIEVLNCLFGRKAVTWEMSQCSHKSSVQYTVSYRT